MVFMVSRMRARMVLSVLLAAVVGAAVLGVLVTAWTGRAGAHGDTRRQGEVITLTGSALTPLIGAKPEELWVYMLHDGEWVRIPAQLDEVSAAGAFVATEDGKLDANDVVAFPADDYAGAQRPADSWPEALEAAYPEVEVKVTDPLDADLAAYFYVFRSVAGPTASLAPLVTYDAAKQEVHARSYTLGYANPDTDQYIGLKRLSMYKGTTNLLDRLKIRAKLNYMGMENQIDEENIVPLLRLLGGGSGMSLGVKPVKVGPVRIILDATGTATADPDRATLLSGLGNLTGIPGGGSLPVSDVRISLDFSAEAVPAKYWDANMAKTVPVDGEEDNVPASPIPAWREIEFTEGRAVLVADRPVVTSTAKVYYKDNANTDVGGSTDTGDKKSYGDNGVMASTLEELNSAGFPGEMVVLPVGRSVTAAQIAENMAKPLVVTTKAGSLPAPRTPSVPTPTAHPTAHPTAAPTARPTVIAGHGHIYLPALKRQQ